MTFNFNFLGKVYLLSIVLTLFILNACQKRELETPYVKNTQKPYSSNLAFGARAIVSMEGKGVYFISNSLDSVAFKVFDKSGTEIPYTEYSIIESPLKGFLRIRTDKEYCMEFETNQFYLVDPQLEVGDTRSLFYDNVLIDDKNKSITTFTKNGYFQVPFFKLSNEPGGKQDPYGNVVYTLANWNLRYIKGDGSILDFGNRSGDYWYGPDSKLYFQYRTSREDSIYIVNGKTYEIDTVSRWYAGINQIININKYQYLSAFNVWVNRSIEILDVENNPKFVASTHSPTAGTGDVKTSNRKIYFRQYTLDHNLGIYSKNPLVDNSIKQIGSFAAYEVNYDDNLIYHKVDQYRKSAYVGAISQYGTTKDLFQINLGAKVIIINCKPAPFKSW